MTIVIGGSAKAGLYGGAEWGDFIMDSVAQTVAPQPTHTVALSQQAVTPYTEGGQTISYNYYSNCNTYWHDLTLNAGCSFYTAGDALFVSDVLTVNGVISFGSVSVNGSQGLSSTGNTFAGGAGAASDPLGQATSPAANGVGAGAAGVLPVQGTGMTGGSNRMGGGSGAGGAGSGGAGGIGRGAAANWPEAAGLPFGFIANLGFNLGPTGITQYLGGSSGGNGAGDGAAGLGCYGGAGGGVVVVCARTIVGSGTIMSPGGNGGNAPANNIGGGGGGAGGLLIIVTQSAVWNGTTYVIPGVTLSAPGGLGGTALGGTGVNGANAVGSGTIVVVPG